MNNSTTTARGDQTRVSQMVAKLGSKEVYVNTFLYAWLVKKLSTSLPLPNPRPLASLKNTVVDSLDSYYA